MIDNVSSKNRANLIKKLPESEHILIGGNALLSKSADVNMPFRQDSNMLYLSGIKQPMASLYIDIKKDKHYIVLPKINKIQETFEGTYDINQILKISGCSEVINYQQLAKLLSNKKVYFNLPAKPKLGNLYTNPFRQWVKQYLLKNGVTFYDIRPKIASLRMVKQPYEIESIKKAVSITKKTLSVIENKLWQNDLTELDIAWEITAEFAKNRVDHAYPAIVAAGKNAATLHHLPGEDKLNESQLVLIDTGAEYNNYAADISRTYTRGKDKIYKDLEQAQKELISFAKPSVTLKQLHQQSVKLLTVVAANNGLDEPIQSLYSHSIGHHLGLDVHDVANYNLALKENMVITIEPGLYSKKQCFGYRVEDDIVITKNGGILL